MQRIIDLHCDTISALMVKQEPLARNSCHFDLDRAKKAGIDIQFFGLFSMPDDNTAVLRRILKQIEKYDRENSLNKKELYSLLAFKDTLSPANKNKMGCLLHLEGAEALGNDVELIHVLYRLGLRSLGLTWNYRNMMAEGVSEGSHGAGLSNLGRRLLKEMQGLGIILDLAHLGEKSFFEAIELYEKPLMVSHANVKHLCPHRRNLSDEQLKAIQANGGIVGVTAVKDFVRDKEATLEHFIDHIVYICEMIGSQHVALGSDFDGADHMVMKGIEDYQHLDRLLEKRNFTSAERESILRGNALRIIEAILKKEQPDVI